VVVLEAGRRWTEETLPESNWQLRKFLWFPHLGMRGIQRMSLLHDVFVLSGAAVGGGSVVYANTLYEPLDAFWTDPSWAHITDWRTELEVHYRQARRMLGATTYPRDTPADRVLRTVAESLGVQEPVHPTDVGVFLGTPGVRVDDPYFGGEGPSRVGCVGCGGCMVGCRFEAKNSLDKNYLFLAERHGAVVEAETEVRDLEPLPGGGYRLHTDRPGALVRHRRRTFTASQVVLAAGTLGTQRLLHRWRDTGRLPQVSPRLGSLTRTNSEAIVGATADRDDIDFSEGVAITSSVRVGDDTQIEPVRYPRGSNLMALLSTMLVDGGRLPRFVRFVLAAIRRPATFFRSLTVRGWARRTVILLVMQSRDNSIVTSRRRSLLRERLVTHQGHGEPNPTWIPVAHRAAREAATVVGGHPRGSVFEALLDRPTTAHIIGGCHIGRSPDEGVIDPYHRLFGYPDIHVVDGSSVPANLGANPSLTITALAERAMSFWPNRGEPDSRPAQGAPYARTEGVPPLSPVVPPEAPGALRRD
jgi:cholesterol oxidase